MSEPLFTGVGVALVTLFTDDGRVDAAATADHAERLVELGMASVLVSGTTGEPASLSPDERVEVLTAVRERLPDVPVLAGVGAPHAGGAARHTRDAVAAGADGVLALAPPSPVDLVAYHRAVVDAAGQVPVLAYHFPAVSSPGVPVGALGSLGVSGIKDSSGDAKRLFETLDTWGGHVYTGSPYLLTLAGSIGAAGAILAIANVSPEAAINAFAGDPESQKVVAAQQTSIAAHRWEGLKRLTAERFGTSPNLRMR